jgi:hypothetical protein
MKTKIILDTEHAAIRLVDLASRLDYPVNLTDGAGMCVSAKSLLGALYAKFDFTSIWLETEAPDAYYVFKDFIAEDQAN